MGKFGSSIAKFALSFLVLTMGQALTFDLAHAQQAESLGDADRYTAVIEDTGQFTNQGIDFLTWDESLLVVDVISPDKHKTRLRGRIQNKIKDVFLEGKPIKVDSKGEFEADFNFRYDTRTFTIRVVDRNNKSFFSQYRIRPSNEAPKPKEVTPETETPPQKSLFRFNAGAGMTVLSYRQQRVEPFSQYAITIKGSVNHPIIKDHIDAGFSGFYNAVGFGSTSPQGFKMRYMGLNARVGYSVIKAPSPYRLNLNVGFYWNTSFSDIGFGNMMGPQVYPEFAYILNNGHSIHAYGKLSPAFSNTYSISFSENREIAAGVHYSFPITDSNRLSVGMDVSQLQLSVDDTWGITNTYSLSGGISF